MMCLNKQWQCNWIILQDEHHEEVSDRRGVRVFVRSRTVRRLGRWDPEPRDPGTPTRRARTFGSRPPEETLLRLPLAFASSDWERKGGQTLCDASLVLQSKNCFIFFSDSIPLYGKKQRILKWSLTLIECTMTNDGQNDMTFHYDHHCRLTLDIKL